MFRNYLFCYNVPFVFVKRNRAEVDDKGKMLPFRSGPFGTSVTVSRVPHSGTPPTQRGKGKGNN